MPEFVKDAFDAFLECGILAQGFLRLRCADCGHGKLVAFNGKRRGFCPSCGARRINWTRAMAGFPAAVRLDASYNWQAQKAAWFMAANSQLNHAPPTN